MRRGQGGTVGELPGDMERWVIYQASLLDLSGIVTGGKQDKNFSQAERSLCGVALQPWIALRSNPSLVTGVREADSEEGCERVSSCIVTVCRQHRATPQDDCERGQLACA